jgi:hypothetical protein
VHTVGFSTDGHGRAALAACFGLTCAAEPGVHPLCPPWLPVGFQNGARTVDLRVRQRRWSLSWQDHGFVTVRMLYLMFVRLAGWMALLSGAGIRSRCCRDRQ